MFIFGSGSMLRGWEIAMDKCSPGSKLLTKVAPALAYGDENYRGDPPPHGAGPGDVIIAEISVVAIHPKHASGAVPLAPMATRVENHRRGVDDAPEQPALFKVVRTPGAGWESPRAPFKVALQMHARYVPRAVGSAVECLGDGGLIEHTLGVGVGVGVGAGDAAGGTPEMLECVERAVETMLVGERCTLFVADPSLVRPSAALPGLPRGAAGVEIDIELHGSTQVRDVFGDGLCFKTRTAEGTGEFPVDCPLEDCDVEFNLVGKVVDRAAVDAGSDPGGRTIESEPGAPFVDTYAAGQPIQATLGMSPLPRALDTSLRLMTQGEVAHVLSAPEYAYDDPTADCARLRAEHGAPPPEAGPGPPSVLWRIELVAWVRGKSKFDVKKFKECIMSASLLREQGNQLFRQGVLSAARLKYEAAVRDLRKAELMADDPLAAATARKPLALCLVNLAAVAQRAGESQKSVARCNEAIEADSRCAKAYYRRGMAHMMHGAWEEARRDFVTMAVRDPELLVERDACLQKLSTRRQEAEAEERRQAQAMLGEDGG